MACVFQKSLRPLGGRGCSVLLAMFWICGILFGASVFLFAGHHLFPLMRGIVSGSVSIVSLLCVTTLPFLFSACSVYVSKPALIFPVCFLKAVGFSYISAGILISYGSSGWLIRWLSMFSNFISLPLLFFFWQRHIGREHNISFLEVFVVLSVLIFIVSIDYCCISPFLAMLINF